MHTTTLLDEEMTKIKVVDLDELYNFIVNDFFSLKSFAISRSFLKLSFFKIQNFKLFKPSHMKR
jgi:hypothetical protein